MSLPYRTRQFGALSCFALAVASFSTQAAEEAAPPADDDTVTLDTVTVQASPLGGSPDDLVQPTTVLAGQELDRKKRGTIGEILENEPGVATSDFGAGVGRPIIRGQAGPRVSVLENGIGSMDVSTISTDHAVSIDPANAQQVEIIRGPATLIYGNGASAGVVNIVDNRLPEEMTEGFSGEIGGSYADNAEERNGKADLNYGVDGFMIHGDYSGRKTGDFDIPGNAFVDGTAPVDGEIPNSQVKTQSGALSVSKIGEAGSFGVAVSRYDDNYGVPKEETAFIDLNQTRVDTQGIWKSPFAGVESIKLRAGHNDYQHTEFEAPGVPGTTFKNDESEGRLELVHEPLAGWRGVLGTQLIHRDFEAIGEEAFVPPTITNSAGLFLVESRAFGERTHVELGGRVEHQEQKPDGVGYEDDNQTPVSLSAGLIYDLTPEYHLRLNATRAQRAPAAEELYAFGPHLATGTFERGNADLGLESANNFEIGLDKHTGRWTWQGSVYYNHIQNYTYLKEADDDGDGVVDQVDASGAPWVEGSEEEGPLTVVDYRQGNANFWGYELQTAYAFLNGPVKLNGRLFTDFVRAKLDDGGGNLPRITPARIGGGLDARYERWSGSVDLTRVERQDDVATLETPTSGYTLLSADVGYKLLQTDRYVASVYLRGRNLLDEEARRHTSFLKDYAPLPGVTAITGFTVDFY